MSNEKHKKTAVVALRLTEQTARHWRDLAEAAGLPLGEFVRQSMGEKGKVRTRTVMHRADRDAYRERSREIAKIGNNINQIARRVNSGHPVGQDVLAELSRIHEAMTRVD